MKSVVTILGARGSVPVSGSEFARFGQATTCILVQMAGETIVVDAGTGMLKLGSRIGSDKLISVLLTHGHADHVLGITMCPLVFDSRIKMKIYAEERSGITAQKMISSLMSPPLWPVGPERLPAEISFDKLTENFNIGNVKVSSIEGRHPGGVSLLKLEGNGKKAVIMSDCTIDDSNISELAVFAEKCDLLLCDGQYSDEEMAVRQNFGHSSWRTAARLGKLCGAKEVRLIHHDPQHTDDILLSAEKTVKEIFDHCSFALDGEEIIL